MANEQRQVLQVTQIPALNICKSWGRNVVVCTCVASEDNARVEKKTRQRLFKSSVKLLREAELSRRSRVERFYVRSFTNEPTDRPLYLAPWLRTLASPRPIELASSHPRHSVSLAFSTLHGFSSCDRVAPDYKIDCARSIMTSCLIPLCEHNDSLCDRLIPQLPLLIIAELCHKCSPWFILMPK